MRARLINEKFEETSDPIADMGIGGFFPGKELDKIFHNTLVSWKEYLMQFLHKKITGYLRANTPDGPSLKVTTGVIVDIKINVKFTNTMIHFIDDKGKNYFFDCEFDKNKQIFIKG